MPNNADNEQRLQENAEQNTSINVQRYKAVGRAGIYVGEIGEGSVKGSVGRMNNKWYK